MPLPRSAPGSWPKPWPMVRATRDHPDLRTGSSVRGSIDFVMVSHRLADLREIGADGPPGHARRCAARVVGPGAGPRGHQPYRRGDRGGALAPLLQPRRARASRQATAGDRPKSLNRPPGGDGGGADVVKEGEEARKAVAEAGRRTDSRRDLARHDGFEEVSPEVGELDEDAFEQRHGRRRRCGVGDAGRPHRRHRRTPPRAGPTARGPRDRRPARGSALPRRRGVGRIVRERGRHDARRRRPRRQPRCGPRRARRASSPASSTT